MSVKNKKRIKHNDRNNRKYDLQNKILQRKNDEIESLKNRISSLEIDCDEKDELINSVDSLLAELREIVEELREKRDKYDELNSDLMQMRKVFDQEVFRGRWRIIKFLMK